MFAIYNNGTVGFRSTSDNLYNLKNVEESQAIEFKPQEGFIEDFTKHNKQNENALNSYKKMANIDTSDIVFHVKDIMTKDCIYIDSKSTIQDAYDILKEHKIPLLCKMNIKPDNTITIFDSNNLTYKLTNIEAYYIFPKYIKEN